MNLRPITPSEMDLKSVPDDKFRPDYPTICFSLNTVPEAKDMNLGDEVIIQVKARVKALRAPGNGDWDGPDGHVDFEVTAIGVEMDEEGTASRAAERGSE